MSLGQQGEDKLNDKTASTEKIYLRNTREKTEKTMQKNTEKNISDERFKNLITILQAAEDYFKPKKADLLREIGEATRTEELSHRQKQKLEQTLVNVFLAGAQKGAEIFTGRSDLFI